MASLGIESLSMLKQPHISVAISASDPPDLHDPINSAAAITINKDVLFILTVFWFGLKLFYFIAAYFTLAAIAVIFCCAFVITAAGIILPEGEFLGKAGAIGIFTGTHNTNITI